jgi:hypothetical protein
LRHTKDSSSQWTSIQEGQKTRKSDIFECGKSENQKIRKSENQKIRKSENQKIKKSNIFECGVQTLNFPTLSNLPPSPRKIQPSISWHAFCTLATGRGGVLLAWPMTWLAYHYASRRIITLLAWPMTWLAYHCASCMAYDMVSISLRFLHGL